MQVYLPDFSNAIMHREKMFLKWFCFESGDAATCVILPQDFYKYLMILVFMIFKSIPVLNARDLLRWILTRKS